MKPPPSLTWLKRPWGGAAGAVGWPERRGWAGPGGGACCTARRPVRTQKAAARGRSALAPLRAPPRAPCLPRQLCSGGSAILQMRRAANRGAGGRPDWPRRAVPDGSEERRWTAVMAPRHAELGADDAVASHRAADGAGPSIEAARTHASGSSRGAAAVSRALGPPQLVLTRPLPFLPNTPVQLQLSPALRSRDSILPLDESAATAAIRGCRWRLSRRTAMVEDFRQRGHHHGTLGDR